MSYDLLNDPLLNKGTAFSDDERTRFGLHGLLPHNIASFEEQISRRLQVLRSFSSDLERYAFLRDLQDTNEILFYGVLTRNIEELLPIVYTPTVGAGCQQFSRLFRKARGLFLSPPDIDRLDSILANPRFDETAVIVMTDGERILGLGDQGAGGMGIPIGKLSLYAACGGLHPEGTLPIMLDVGTNNADCLADPLYVGWRHERVRGAQYDEFVEAVISAIVKRWPNVLLQFEDFAKDNAARLLDHYRDRLCTFNDDIQGTAAVATGTLLSAINVTGETLQQQKIVFLGAGSAGCGIASLMVRTMVDAGADEKTAAAQIYLIDRNGLMFDDAADASDAQKPYLTRRVDVAGWQLDTPGKYMLIDVLRNVKPQVLIGVSGQPGAFTQPAIEEMAKHVERPIIFPLSNPTSRAEATPVEIMAWTNSKAIIGTGSPFPPIARDGGVYKVDQTNNSYIFPGVGLGVLAVKARRVSDTMFMAAAKALADASPTKLNRLATLLPPVSELREVAINVALAVARAAHAEGLSDVPPEDIQAAVTAQVWTPEYTPLLKIT